MAKTEGIKHEIYTIKIPDAHTNYTLVMFSNTKLVNNTNIKKILKQSQELRQNLNFIIRINKMKFISFLNK